MRAHPIAKVGVLLVLFRLVGLAVRYLVQPAGSLADRLALFLPAAASHAGALLVVISCFLALAALSRAARRPIAVVACVSFAALMIAGQADLTVATITGAPLTPTLFRTFRGLHVVRSNEFLEPLRANALLAASGFVVFLVLCVWMASVVRHDRAPAGKPLRPALASALAGIALLWLPGLITWPGPPPPIEVAFAREYLGLDRTTLAGSEADAIREIRDAVGLPPGASWLSDRYPLVYGWNDASVRASDRDRPDIIVVMIESQRAEDLAFVTGSGESVTPNLDAFAARSVVFPVYTSNGFPTAPSVLAFHCSAWPHRRKEIITDFAHRGFDSIPSRLRSAGYEATYVGADPNFDNQDLWLGRWYSTVVDLVASGIEATDRNIVTRAIEEIRRHDVAAPQTPLFEFVSTYSTHYPFRLPSDSGETPLPVSDPLRPRYRQVLRYTDREVGALLSYLESRPRRDRTITIVLGDHGFYTDLRKTSGVPENDNIWTAAMIAGPIDRIGPARRIVEPASHVDMLPTILALVGDRRPSAALGSDLLGPARRSPRSAFAIRPGGLRFDRDGLASVIDARVPNRIESRMAFPGLMSPRAQRSDLTATSLNSLVTDWSFLIEQDRVWSPSFLNAR